MTYDYATAQDFENWRNHARQCDNYSLRWLIEDCRKAAKCMRGFNPAREGYYEDQAFTYADELNRRHRKQS